MSASLIKQRGRRYLWSFLLIITLLFNASFFKPKEFLDDSEQFYYTDEGLIQREMSGILPDYIPLQMAEELIPPTSLAWCEQDCSKELEVLIDRSHENLIKTNFKTNQIVEFAVADFPGWKVEVDGHPAEKRMGSVGNIAVDVAAGEHLVGVRFTSSNIRFWSDLVSIFSLAIYVYLSLELKDTKRAA